MVTVEGHGSMNELHPYHWVVSGVLRNVQTSASEPRTRVQKLRQSLFEPLTHIVLTSPEEVKRGLGSAHAFIIVVFALNSCHLCLHGPYAPLETRRDHETSSMCVTLCPVSKILSHPVELELGRTRNGLEWLSYDAPRNVAMHVWRGEEALAMSSMQKPYLSLLSSGAGMGPLGKNLTELEAAILDHTRRGHPSPKRASISRKATKGGLRVTLEGMSCP